MSTNRMSKVPETVEEAAEMYKPEEELEHDMANCLLCRMEQIVLAKKRIQQSA